MSRFRSELAIVLAAATTLAGCGFTAPHDKLTVIFNGERTTVAQSGTIKAEFGDLPELNYEGPIGCQGRYFDSGDASDQDFTFRYSAREALLLRGNTLYRFHGPPRRVAGEIVWNHTFGGDRISVLANCPMP
jgi:hypothetical protein